MPIKIKNWERFQHFKDRRPLWVKLYRDLLDDIEWHSLEPAAAKLLVSLWLLASEDDGDLPEIEVIAFRLRITKTVVESTITKLSHWLIMDNNNLTSTCYQDDNPHALAERREEKREKRVSKRAHTLPDDFELSESSLDYSRKNGLAAGELDSFKNWHTAKGTVYKDWQAAWRTWCDKAVSYGRAGKPQAKKAWE